MATVLEPAVFSKMLGQWLDYYNSKIQWIPDGVSWMRKGMDSAALVPGYRALMVSSHFVEKVLTAQVRYTGSPAVIGDMMRAGAKLQPWDKEKLKRAEQSLDAKARLEVATKLAKYPPVSTWGVSSLPPGPSIWNGVEVALLRELDPGEVGYRTVAELLDAVGKSPVPVHELQRLQGTIINLQGVLERSPWPASAREALSKMAAEIRGKLEQLLASAAARLPLPELGPGGVVVAGSTLAVPPGFPDGVPGKPGRWGLAEYGAVAGAVALVAGAAWWLKERV